MGRLKHLIIQLMRQLGPLQPFVVRLVRLLAALPVVGRALAPPAGNLLTQLGQTDAAVEVLGEPLSGDEGAFRLARAYEVRGDQDRAFELYRLVLDRTPQHGGALHGLGRVLAAQQRWDAALEPLERAVVAKPAAWEVCDLLGRCYLAVDDWHGAAYQFERASRLAPLQAPVHARHGKALAKARRYDEYRALREAAELRPSTVRYWVDLGEFLLSVGSVAAARRSFARATKVDLAQANSGAAAPAATHRSRIRRVVARLARSGPRSGSQEARQYAALGRALIEDRRPSLDYDSTLGLTVRPVGRLDEAGTALEAALALDASRAAWHAKLGEARMARRDFAGAVEAFEGALTAGSRSARHHHQLGRAYQHPSVRRFGAALQAFEAALVRDPSNRPAAVSLMKLSARTQRWGVAWGVAQQLRDEHSGVPLARTLPVEFRASFDALFGPQADEVDVSRLVTRLGDVIVSGGTLDREVLRLVATRVAAMGHFTLAADVRHWSAELSTRGPVTKRAGRTALTSRVKALYLLGRLTGDELATAAALAGRTPDLRRDLERKWSADLNLVHGRPSPLVALAAERRAATPLPGEELFTSLIEGRRIAIVGPSATQARNGAEIDEFDTVIRPRFRPDFVRENEEFGGSSTHISYYSGHDLNQMEGELAAYLRDGQLQQVVARPLMYRPELVREGHQGIRFYRDEFSLYYEALPLGIQRIIYDVLQFGPSEIKVFNTDFYTGSVRFAPGYRDPRDYEVAEDSLLNDIFSSHDLGQDFDFVRALTARGLVTLDRTGTDLMNLGRVGYLHRLEALGAF